MPITRATSLRLRFAQAHCAILLLALAAITPTSARGADADDAYSGAIRVTPLLKTETDGAGRKLAYPTSGQAEVTAVLVEIPPGAQTNWHQHPVPCFAYMLEGELQVETADGTVRTLKAGQAFPEVVNLLHNGTNRTEKPARLVMFALGVAGQPYAVREDPPVGK